MNRNQFENIPSAEIDEVIARPGLAHIRRYLDSDAPTELERDKCKIGLSSVKSGTEKMRAENAQATAAMKAVESVGVSRDVARKKVEAALNLASGEVMTETRPALAGEVAQQVRG